jgi:pyocin large subunit-like protein
LSIHATSWAFKVQNISSSAKFVLIAISDAHNGHTGECFPTVKRIMAMTLLGRSTVLRCTAELEQAGLFHRELKRQKGRVRGVQYHLAFDQVPNRDPVHQGPKSGRARVPNRDGSKENGKEGTGTVEPSQEATPFDQYSATWGQA